MIVGSVLISFNGLVLRNIDFADSWTVIFYRAYAFTLAIFLFLFFKYKMNVFKIIKKHKADIAFPTRTILGEVKYDMINKKGEL